MSKITNDQLNPVIDTRYDHIEYIKNTALMHNVAPAKTARSCRQVMYALGSVAKKQTKSDIAIIAPTRGIYRGGAWKQLASKLAQGESSYPPSLTIFIHSDAFFAL